MGENFKAKLFNYIFFIQLHASYWAYFYFKNGLVSSCYKNAGLKNKKANTKKPKSEETQRIFMPDNNTSPVK